MVTNFEIKFFIYVDTIAVSTDPSIGIMIQVTPGCHLLATKVSSTRTFTLRVNSLIRFIIIPNSVNKAAGDTKR